MTLTFEVNPDKDNMNQRAKSVSRII